MLLFTLLFFVFLSLVFVLTVAFDRERRVLHVVSRWWSLSIFRLCPWWRLNIEGWEGYRHAGPYVVVTNHGSMFDIPIMYLLRLDFKWIAKKEVYRWPLFGAVLWMHGDIAIERGTASGFRRMVRQAGEHLKAGTSVIIFPEGTRSRDGRIHRFREGAFLMAKEVGADILPCVIDGTGDMTDGRKFKMPHRFRVRVLQPVSAAGAAGMTVAGLAEKVEKIMKEEHRAMRPDLYENQD